ncbi:hypothetical protein BGW38_005755 [Lunasporangiospora selenospora]|uniref:Uncharacterized protein n=1 Tax=Lunasporangiospora selenospora TaxID=979761 RepID=A0A9P6FPI8_9FUNG|nr:hypothetical protein BGW38_005755 [Lunasporangiospora selenospora]
MATQHSQVQASPAPHTFLVKKPPLMPRQSTNDVLSFTHIIADRLLPDQTVWDFFSPAPEPVQQVTDHGSRQDAVELGPRPVSAGLPGNVHSGTTQLLTPTSPSTTTNDTLPKSPELMTFAQLYGMRRRSIAVDTNVSTATAAEEKRLGQKNAGNKTATATTSNHPGTTMSTSVSGSALSSVTTSTLTTGLAKESSSPSSSMVMDRSNPSPSLLTPVSPSFPSNAHSALSPSAESSEMPGLTTTTSTTTTTTATTATTTTTTTTTTTGSTSKLQKRRSFAQSLRSSMLSLTQLLTLPSNNQGGGRKNLSGTLKGPKSSTGHGPPHYNILVLGSDSAPLASTLYKMSTLLPRTSKVQHYQEISGFFVAYFRSNALSIVSPPPLPSLNASLTLSPLPTLAVTSSPGGSPPPQTKAALVEDSNLGSAEVQPRDSFESTGEVTLQGEVKDRYEMELDYEQEEADMVRRDEAILRSVRGRTSEETLHQLRNSTAMMGLTDVVLTPSSSASLSRSRPLEGLVRSGSSGSSCSQSSGHSSDSSNTFQDMAARFPAGEMREMLLEEKSSVDSKKRHTRVETASSLSSSSTSATTTTTNRWANASLSVHAFSLDTTWPVPRTLAQTFWFPHAHGIIYIVDATRKNDARGMDHLLNARLFLNSLITDPHFGRRDLPIVVFANKAGMDETCYRVDEIAEILGCEDWDICSSQATMTKTGKKSLKTESPSLARPWCVKSTRADGTGDGLKESVEWLKSRMSEIWQS